MTALKEFLVRYQSILHKHANVFPLLLKSLSVLFKEFIEFVLSKYIETGESELSEEKLPSLLKLKYQAIADAKEELGEIADIRSMFIDFQKYLYEEKEAS